jgi:hypothetical protein
MSLRLFLALALCSTACVKLKADLPPICGSTSVTVPGTGSVSPLIAGSKYTVTQSFQFGGGTDLSYLTSVVLSGGTLTPGGTVSDFSFIDEAQLVVMPPDGSSLKPVTLVDWQKSSGTTASIAIPAETANLKDYFSDAGFSFQVTVTGTPPSADWGVNVDLCAQAAVDDTVSL